MKKLLLLLLIPIMGCSADRETNNQWYKEIMIDSCEYIATINCGCENYANVIHKGNCHNPIHKIKLDR